ncbi:MAG TPA: hypothetical protein VIV40_41040 [Kofleriaceae bacterium]
MSRTRPSTSRSSKRVASDAIAGNGGGSATTAGALASATWLRGRGATPPSTTRWHVEIALDVVNERAPSEFDEATATRFHLDIYTEEWGFFFCNHGRSSWIRVTDIAFVHGRDDFQLLTWTPALKDIGQLLRRIEREHHIAFQRSHASIKTNLPNIEPEIRAWLATL